MSKQAAATIRLPEQLARIDPNVDPYGCLGLVRHPDGSISRQFEVPMLPASSDPSSCNSLVLTKDITINEATNTWVRLFLPRTALHPSNITKLPLIVDFHGGGFVVASAGSAYFNDFYTIITSGIPAVIVSVDYRRAPEHRLPAAYDDCVEGLYWIKNANEEWLTKYADFDKCFLMGTSAGGNIAYHVGLRAASCADDDLEPLHIRGLILHQPFFGGNNRTGSETRLVNDKVIPQCVVDILWEISLPAGADRDHEYCNPMFGVKTHLLDQIRRLGWKILVVGCDGDPLSDRQIEFVGMLKDKGLQVVGKFEEGGHHGLEVMNPEKAKAFALVVKEVLMSSDNA